MDGIQGEIRDHSGYGFSQLKTLHNLRKHLYKKSYLDAKIVSYVLEENWEHGRTVVYYTKWIAHSRRPNAIGTISYTDSTWLSLKNERKFDD